MLTRDGYPPGVPCWVDTAQPDPEAAAAFYGGLFGWELEDRMPAGAPGRYLVARLHGYDVAAVGSQPEAPPPTPMWNTYVAVDSADNTAAKVKAAGGAVLGDLFDVLDAGRMGVCADPAGAVFGLWQAKDHKGAQLVLITKYNTEVRWGQPVTMTDDNFFVEVSPGQKLAYLKAIYEEKGQVDAHFKWVDIRFDAVTYPRGVGAAQTAGADLQR